MAGRSPRGDSSPRAAVVDCVQSFLHAAPLTSAYRAALTKALTLPGNILSETPDVRWAHLVWTCCTAAGGRWSQATPVAAAVEIFMVALDVLDDEEDGEPSPLRADLGPARTLNVSTGLLFLAQQALLGIDSDATAAAVLLDAGLRACSGQHADLVEEGERCRDLDAALSVTAGKSASLVAAVCRLGALCAGAHASLQAGYARFGSYLGMVAQLANDVVAIAPGATGKTDIALGRPTLPLTYAARYDIVDIRADDPATRTMLWTGGPAYLTWTVAETYRRQALDLIPHLTTDQHSRVALAALLPSLCWTQEDAA